MGREGGCDDFGGRGMLFGVGFLKLTALVMTGVVCWALVSIEEA